MRSNSVMIAFDTFCEAATMLEKAQAVMEHALDFFDLPKGALDTAEGRIRIRDRYPATGALVNVAFEYIGKAVQRITEGEDEYASAVSCNEYPAKEGSAEE